MKTHLKETSTGKMVAAEIVAAQLSDMPLKKDGWNFNWRALYKKPKSIFYKAVLADSTKKIEGIIMLTLQEDGILYMDCIEVAPINYGSKGKYDFVAGALLAFGCHLSREFGKPPYEGYLSFESKTVLIELYEKKYGASWAMGRRMFFSPEAGIKLMELYLQGSEIV